MAPTQSTLRWSQCLAPAPVPATAAEFNENVEVLGCQLIKTVETTSTLRF